MVFLNLIMHKRLIWVFVILIFIVACKKDNAGSNAPQITPVQSTIKADWGDEIILTGKNIPLDASVFFGENQATVISNNGSEIRCIVPNSFDDQLTTSVYIKYKDQTIELKNYITLNAPLITSFTPTQAIGDTVIIKGNHFSTFKLHVKFGDTEAKVVGLSKQSLKVLVPDDIKSIHTTISVTSQLQTALAGSTFEVLKPVITNITPEAFIGDKVVITGKYFHPLGPFFVYLDDEQVGATIENNGVISFNVPYKTYPGRKTTIKIKLLEYEVTYPVDLKIKDNWVMVSKGIPFSAYNATPLIIGSQVYVVAQIKGFRDDGFYLWRFNQTDFSWTKIGNPITTVKGSYRVGTNGSKIYLYNSNGPDTFYECDPTSGTWTTKANFIGPQRNDPVMFGIGGKLYMGAGAHYVDNIRKSIDDWYVYTPATNTWAQIADMRKGFEDGYPMALAQSVVINNIAYVLCGGWFEGYKYNPAANTWTGIQNALEPRTQVGVVAYKNKIYTLKGYLVQNVGNSNRDIFSYDPASDHWEFEPVKVDPYSDELDFAFISGGKIYMLSYDASESQNNLYEALMLP
ncbi:Kelch motif-containing protein [Mucilaginibacter lappiensis]|nr:Kelch motif-containing protein [Mucilaginibacter lappiensis]